MSRFQGMLIQEFADSAARRVAARAMRKLRKITDTLSGDDSGLNNAWEEICVQVQGEDSVFWDIYKETMESLACNELEEMPSRDLASLWLQTDDGWNWHYDIELGEQDGERQLKSTEATPVPYDVSAIAQWIVSEYLVPMADRYSNRNIARYLEDRSSYEMDY